MRAGTGTLLNFTLKFGEKNLKNYLEEIVLPAFFGNHKRQVGKKTSFSFIEVNTMDFGSDEKEDIAIVGQFVKDTILESNQALVAGKLVERRDELQSSPSSTFALFLSDHKLLYYSDTPYAPNYSSFKSTALKFLKLERNNFINEEHKRLKKRSDKAITKQELKKVIPNPTLTILPMPNRESASKFVNSFDVLKTLTFKVIEPNDEAQASQFFEDLKSVSSDLNATNSTKFNNKDGLEKNEATDLVASAAEKGITDIRATGAGEEGERLVKTSEDLTVEVELSPMPPTKRGRIRKLLTAFRNMGLR